MFAISVSTSELSRRPLSSRLLTAGSYSIKMLHKSYLLRFDGAVVERPQFLYMRVAVALHGRDLVRVLETYELLSERAYTHATPTLYNAGTTSQYLASCFLYQPPVEGTVSVMGRCVTDISALWTVDGGVGLSLGGVPAREYVVRSLVIPRRLFADLCIVPRLSRTRQDRSRCWTFSTYMHEFIL